jgi:hypothetical protein
VERKSWFAGGFGIFALFRGIEQLSDRPSSVRGFLSLGAGMVLTGIFAFSLWQTRRREAQPAPPKLD